MSLPLVDASIKPEIYFCVLVPMAHTYLVNEIDSAEFHVLWSDQTIVGEILCAFGTLFRYYEFTVDFQHGPLGDFTIGVNRNQYGLLLRVRHCLLSILFFHYLGLTLVAFLVAFFGVAWAEIKRVET
jgi:hypothetical protein